MRGLRKAAVRPPVTPEIMVTIMIFGALLSRGWNISPVEPPLKKSQLTKRRIVP